MNRALSARQIWGMPVAVAVTSAIGLISALLDDGVWDALSWITLSAPILLSAWYGRRRHT
ncbi:MAG: hypothetical protein LZF86_10047 [Nitrospira sp.]|nr:MAG: hypothetical protein LZF86_10047 [Nitrospira sp.]